MVKFRMTALIAIVAFLTAGCVYMPAPYSWAPDAGSRGYVAHVSSYRVITDLTARDGLRPGSTVSIWRDKVRILHPVTGQLLGEVDEKVGVAKVVEVHDRFSVAELQAPAVGQDVRVKDRVTPLPFQRSELRIPVAVP